MKIDDLEQDPMSLERSKEFTSKNVKVGERFYVMSNGGLFSDGDIITVEHIDTDGDIWFNCNLTGQGDYLYANAEIMRVKDA